MVCVTGISQTMAVWKTVLPNSSLFTNREWVWLKFHGLWTVQCVICPSLALLAKDTVQLKWWGNLAKPWYNDKTPPFFSGLWLKTAVLGPPKLPSGLELRSLALGQFWRPSDGSFSRLPRKKVELWPRRTKPHTDCTGCLNPWQG